MKRKTITVFLCILALILVVVIVSELHPKTVQAPFFPQIGTKEITTATSSPVIPSKTGFPYIEIVNSCGPYYDGVCVNMRSGPGSQYPVVLQLRSGVVLKVDSTVTRDGHTWYKVDPGPEIHYPERVTSAWYVSADYANLFYNDGDQELEKGGNATTTKRIVIDIGKQMLYAYDGDLLFMQEAVSTGLPATPTPHGTFKVFRKTPSRYMQGPVPGVSDQYYDLPGVPWDLYFTKEGGAIHGTYWHAHFGEKWSHGCVNLPLDAAEKLYEWTPLGTPVMVVD